MTVIQGFGVFLMALGVSFIGLVVAWFCGLSLPDALLLGAGLGVAFIYGLWIARRVHQTSRSPVLKDVPSD